MNIKIELPRNSRFARIWIDELEISKITQVIDVHAEPGSVPTVKLQLIPNNVEVEGYLDFVEVD